MADQADARSSRQTISPQDSFKPTSRPSSLQTPYRSRLNGPSPTNLAQPISQRGPSCPVLPSPSRRYRPRQDKPRAALLDQSAQSPSAQSLVPSVPANTHLSDMSRRVTLAAYRRPPSTSLLDQSSRDNPHRDPSLRLAIPASGMPHLTEATGRHWSPSQRLCPFAYRLA